MLVSFAGLTVDIEHPSPYTRDYCAAYLAPQGASADFSVSVTHEEILREGEVTPETPLGYLETLALYRKICERALAYDTFLFHGSALTLDGEGVLFTAPSGMGKSTHASLWRQVFGERVTMVNDDKPLLAVKEDGVTVSGTPWDGKHRLSTPLTVPLRAICFLRRQETNSIRPLSPRDALPALLRQSYRPQDPALVEKTLSLLTRLSSLVPCYLLSCNMDAEAARVARDGIFPRDPQT